MAKILRNCTFVDQRKTFRWFVNHSYLSTRWLRGSNKLKWSSSLGLPWNESFWKFRRCARRRRGALSVRSREVNRYLKKDSRGVWKAGLTFARLVIKRLTHVLPSTSGRVQSHREIGKLGWPSALLFPSVSPICPLSVHRHWARSFVKTLYSRSPSCTRTRNFL